MRNSILYLLSTVTAMVIFLRFLDFLGFFDSNTVLSLGNNSFNSKKVNHHPKYLLDVQSHQAGQVSVPFHF